MKAAEYLELEPQDCLVIEDAYAGIEAAKSGGFIAVAIGDATTHEKADFKIKTFEQLLKIIGL